MTGGHAAHLTRTGSAHDSLHAHLHIPGHSVVHRLDPALKVLGLMAFVIVVAVTPPRAWPVFAAEAAVIAVVVLAARLPVRTVVARAAPVLPFLAMAAFVPFVAGGPKVDVWGVGLSRSGLWSAQAIAARALIGATATVVLAATTPIPELIRALGRLRVPPVITAIVTFMFRYLDLLLDQVRRMRTAMAARCHDPRWLWQAKPIALGVGSLFVRTFERGERVHQAMLARGFDGTMPDLGEHRDHGDDSPGLPGPGSPGHGSGHARAAAPWAFVPAAVALAALLCWRVR